MNRILTLAALFLTLSAVVLIGADLSSVTYAALSQGQTGTTVDMTGIDAETDALIAAELAENADAQLATEQAARVQHVSLTIVLAPLTVVGHATHKATRQSAHTLTASDIDNAAYNIAGAVAGALPDGPMVPVCETVGPSVSGIYYTICPDAKGEGHVVAADDGATAHMFPFGQ